MKARPSTILIVDDVAANVGALSGALERAGYRVLAALSGEAALKSAAKAHPDLILLDVLMPDMDGVETCRRLKADAATTEIPVIFLTANDATESLVDGLRAGGVDYVTKPFQTDEVLARVSTHLRVHQLACELAERNEELADRNDELAAANEKLRAEIRRREEAEDALRFTSERLSQLSEEEVRRWGVPSFVGQSEIFGRIVQDIRRVQEFPNTNVLLQGESGTGKELVARAIHFGGPRARAPFVAINCSALPQELTESLFFGHVRGAFTGATEDRRGYFEHAHGGTLFLDEIGDMPAALQAKLLRVLESGEVTPVGGSVARKVSVRIVAATHVDLPAHVADGAFRQDLYYRLMHFRVVIPPLRERREDIPALARHFLTRFAAEMGRPAPALHTAALERLLAYDYPGNIRELKNTLERAVIHAAGSDLTAEHIDFAPARRAADGETAAPSAEAANELATVPFNLEAAEQVLIDRALRACGGNVSAAARLLGVNRTRIYRREKPE